MELSTARIPVRSRREAMDWSLVLISQGIESTIDHSGEGGGWGLIVRASEQEGALTAIHQYQLENRRWPWRKEVFQPGLLFDWTSIGWVLLLALFFWLDAQVDLAATGLMDSAAVGRGQWWRLFTAVWLHADISHLATNAGFGLVLLGLAMARYGTGVGLLAAYLAGAGGNLVAGLVGPTPHRSLGASGMVMGALGLLAVSSFSLWSRTPKSGKPVVAGILGGVMLFILLGVTPGTDVAAHFGGFVTGALLGGLLTLVPRPGFRPKTNLACGILFALLIIIPWWLAFRRS